MPDRASIVTVLNLIAPVLAVIGLGAWLCRRGHYSSDFFRYANRLAYSIGLPALLVREVSRTALQGERLFILSAVILATAAVATALAWAVARWARLAPPKAAAVVACTFRSNIAYVGLPIVLYALPAANPANESIRALAALLLAPLVFVYNLGCVLLCTAMTRGRSVPKEEILRSVVLNPLILSSLAGGLAAAANLPIPVMLGRTLDILGSLALPMALLALGASLDLSALQRDGWPWFLFAAITKTMLSPIVAWTLAAVWGLDPNETLLVTVYVACPTAVAMYIMAGPLGVDERWVGAMITLSTLLSVLPLSFILWLGL